MDSESLENEEVVTRKRTYIPKTLKMEVVKIAIKYPLLIKQLTDSQKLLIKDVWKETLERALNELKAITNVDVDYKQFKKIFKLIRISVHRKKVAGIECNSDLELKLADALETASNYHVKELRDKDKEEKKKCLSLSLKEHIVEMAEKYPLLIMKLKPNEKLQLEKVLDTLVTPGLDEINTRHNLQLDWDEFKKIFRDLCAGARLKINRGYEFIHDYEPKLIHVSESANNFTLSEFIPVTKNDEPVDDNSQINSICTNDDEPVDDNSQINSICTNNVEPVDDSHLKRICNLLTKQFEINNFQAETKDDGEVIGYDFNPEEFLSINICGLNESNNNTTITLNDDTNMVDEVVEEDNLAPIVDSNENDFENTPEIEPMEVEEERVCVTASPPPPPAVKPLRVRKCCVRIKRLKLSQNCIKPSVTLATASSETSISSYEDMENPIINGSLNVIGSKTTDLKDLSTEELEKRFLIETIKQVRMQISYYENRLALLNK